MSLEIRSDPIVDEAVVAVRLRAIWSDLLGGAEVQDRDHFTELGGDSIAAAVCIVRIREEWNIDVGVAALLLDDVSFTSLVEDVRRRIAERETRSPVRCSQELVDP